MELPEPGVGASFARRNTTSPIPGPEAVATESIHQTGPLLPRATPDSRPRVFSVPPEPGTVQRRRLAYMAPTNPSASHSTQDTALQQQSSVPTSNTARPVARQPIRSTSLSAPMPAQQAATRPAPLGANWEQQYGSSANTPSGIGRRTAAATATAAQAQPSHAPIRMLATARSTPDTSTAPATTTTTATRPPFSFHPRPAVASQPAAAASNTMQGAAPDHSSAVSSSAQMGHTAAGGAAGQGMGPGSVPSAAGGNNTGVGSQAGVSTGVIVSGNLGVTIPAGAIIRAAGEPSAPSMSSSVVSATGAVQDGGSGISSTGTRTGIHGIGSHTLPSRQAGSHVVSTAAGPTAGRRGPSGRFQAGFNAGFYMHHVDTESRNVGRGSRPGDSNGSGGSGGHGGNAPVDNNAPSVSNGIGRHTPTSFASRAAGAPDLSVFGSLARPSAAQVTPAGQPGGAGGGGGGTSSGATTLMRLLESMQPPQPSTATADTSTVPAFLTALRAANQGASPANQGAAPANQGALPAAPDAADSAWAEMARAAAAMRRFRPQMSSHELDEYLSQGLSTATQEPPVTTTRAGGDAPHIGTDNSSPPAQRPDWWNEGDAAPAAAAVHRAEGGIGWGRAAAPLAGPRVDWVRLMRSAGDGRAAAGDGRAAAGQSPSSAARAPGSSSSSDTDGAVAASASGVVAASASGVVLPGSAVHQANFRAMLAERDRERSRNLAAIRASQEALLQQAEDLQLAIALSMSLSESHTPPDPAGPAATGNTTTPSQPPTNTSSTTTRSRAAEHVSSSSTTTTTSPAQPGGHQAVPTLQTWLTPPRATSTSTHPTGSLATPAAPAAANNTTAAGTASSGSGGGIGSRRLPSIPPSVSPDEGIRFPILDTPQAAAAVRQPDADSTTSAQLPGQHMLDSRMRQVYTRPERPGDLLARLLWDMPMPGPPQAQGQGSEAQQAGAGRDEDAVDRVLGEAAGMQDDLLWNLVQQQAGGFPAGRVRRMPVLVRAQAGGGNAGWFLGLPGPGGMLNAVALAGMAGARLPGAGFNLGDYASVDHMSYEQLVNLEDVKVPTPSHVLQGLPRVTHSSKEAATGGYAGPCSICMEKYADGEVLVKLPCKHVFHDACASQWLGEFSKVCPVCKGCVVQD